MDASQAKQQFNEADALYRAGRHEDALRVLDALDAAYPNTKNVLYPRALCLAHLGRFTEADRICNHLESFFQDKRCPELRRILVSLQQPAGDDSLARLDEFDLNETAIPPPPRPGDLGPSKAERPYLKYGIIAAVLALIALFVVFPLATYSPPEDMPETATPSRDTVVLDPTSVADLPPEQLQRIALVFFLIILPLAIAISPFALFVTLMVRAKLPFDTFGANYLSTLGYTLLGILLSMIPCIGFIIAIVIIYRRYEMDIVDLLIWIGIGAVFAIAQNILFGGILLAAGFQFA